MDILGQSTVAYDNCSKIDKNPGLNLEDIQVPLYTLLYKSQNAYRMVSADGIVPCINQFSILIQNICLDSRIPESSGEDHSVLNRTRTSRPAPANCSLVSAYRNLLSRKAIKEKIVGLTIVENKARWDVTIIATGRKNTYAPGHECLPSLVENTDRRR